MNIWLKALSIIIGHVHPGRSGWLLLPRTAYDYEAQARDGRQSSIIAACVRWAMRTLPEAPFYLTHLSANREAEAVIEHQHPFLELLETPNRFYDGHLLQMALVADLMLSGNSYARKVRGGGGKPVELWWMPSVLVSPKWEGIDYISYYSYMPGGAPVKIAVEDVIHFRDGLDPKNTRLGLSPLQSLFREIFTDDEAANMTASLLKNMGIPGILVAPEGEGIPSEADVKETKEFFKAAFTGDRRGEPLVMSGPTKVSQFGFNPQQMELRSLRQIPEERISAVLGIPAIVAGLGAGLARSTFANVHEAREMAYESTIVPMQRLFAAVLRRQLLPDFEKDIRGWHVAYDLSDVRVLQEDQNKLAERMARLVAGGIYTVGEARRKLGDAVDETHDIYLRPLALLEVPKRGPRPALTEGEAEKGFSLKRLLSPQERQLAMQRTLRLRLSMRRDAERLEAVFQGRLEGIFRELGSKAKETYLAVTGKAQAGVETKQEPERIFIRLAIEKWTLERFVPGWKAYYMLVGETVFGTLAQTIDPRLFLDEPLRQRILELGGKRAGLIDLSQQTKDAMFKAIKEGADLGESTREIANRVSQQVSAGPWRTVETRANTIARTETNYAQNMASVEAYAESAVVKGIMILDAQLGPTDAECEAMNGQIVGAEEARQLMAEEHPNGTRAVVPLI